MEDADAKTSAASTFADLGLDPRLLLALEKRQYETPTTVQAACIPAALEGKDVVARAKTGSGKTLAYLLPALHKILALPKEKQRAGWQALIFVPTRELCEQVREEAEAVATRCKADIRVSSLAVDSAAVQRDIFLHIGQVVISTPGQVAQALKEGRLRAASFQPDERMRRPGLSTLVLDEADLMLSMPGYEEDLQAIAPLIPRSCQCLLMSATSSAEVERLQKLVLHNPTTLNLLGNDADASGAAGPGPGSAAEIEHFHIACDRNDKLLHTMVLLKLGMVRKKVLLFVNSIDAGFRLKLFLEAFGIRSAVINAELPLNSRHHILQEFNKGIFDYLIATDDPAKRLEQEEEAAKPAPQLKPAPVKAKGKGRDRDSRKRGRGNERRENDSEFGVIRGIDFQGVKTVINVDVPESVQTYVHRVGRTGRAGQAGTAITIFTPADSAFRTELEQQLGGQPASTSASNGAEADQQGGLRQFERLTKASVEGLRYRAEDIARSLTKSSIKEARAKELRLELLNSRRLQAHFEEHPADLALLKHDKPLAKAAAPSHLKHIPAYLRDPAAASGRSASGNAGPGMLPLKKKRKMERGKDPLKGGFVRAPKRGGDVGEPLTEMEQAAQEEGQKLARKLAKKQGKAGTFVPKRNIQLEAVDAESLACILTSIYHGSVNVGNSNVEALLLASNYLDVAPVKAACCQFLKANLRASSCLHTLALAAMYDCQDLSSDTMTFVKGHFVEVMSGEGKVGLQELPEDVLRDLLQSEELETQSEMQVLEAILIWWEADPDVRSTELPNLLSTIRLSPSELQHQVAESGVLRMLSDTAAIKAAQCLEHFVRARDRLSSNSGASSSTSGPTLPPQPRRCMPMGLLAAGGHDAVWRSLRTSEYYDPNQDMWSTGPPLPDSVSFAAYSVLQGNLCVVNGSPHLCSVLLYQRSRKHWLRCRPLLTPRLHAAMASAAGRVWVMGGRTGQSNTELQSVESLRIGWGDAARVEEESWTSAPAMCTPRTALGAAAVAGRIYAVGGQDGKHIHRSVECLDLERGQWALLSAQLPSERKYHSVCELGGRLYAVGGMTSTRQRLDSVVAYDPREGRWAAVAPMSVPRSSAGVAMLHGRLYVVGGNAGDAAFHTSAEAFSVEAGRWRSCAPTSYGRSSLALAAV
ncbi:hypothetical protein WJX75_000482 [Coccomyxa subellipsoidea]|uniref:RNA helicase n=1 Tax=Coccomyxa subellipsoidea TaxID=248742 RepID=A0ABR2YIS9_9CHLO